MATAFSPGGQSPTSLSRTLERVFDDAKNSGEINLSGRKLKEYPSIATKYDLSDTSSADLSKNRFSEIPCEICEYHSLEKLNCYHNVIRCLPEALIQLQNLVHLNLSRNMLSFLPPFLCRLQSLEVLLASNNKLVSLPEELGMLDKLMDLDVSCNEITHLPPQLGNMESLRNLNLRRNLLIELPVEISKLNLRKLDFSGNKISQIPFEFRKLDSLEQLTLKDNPLTSPPANLCTKGKVHIMKYLATEAIKEDRKRGIMSEVDIRKQYRKSAPPIHPSLSDEFRNMQNLADSPGERRKRNTVDSGYSTTDSTVNERLHWSPSEANTTEVDEAPGGLTVKAGEVVKEQRRGRETEQQKSVTLQARTPPSGPVLTAPSSAYNKGTPPGVTSIPVSTPPSGGVQNLSDPFAGYELDSPGNIGLVDEFTRELQRQKSEYEAKKKAAEERRKKLEEEEIEKEERRRAALKIQENQKAILEQQREEARQRHNSSSSNSSMSTTTPSPGDNLNHCDSLPRKVNHSHSFKEEKKAYQNNNNYRRTVSETGYSYSQSTPSPGPDGDYGSFVRKNGIHREVSPSPESSPGGDPYIHAQNNTNPTEEFRSRHEAVLAQHRREALNVKRRLEEEKQRVKLIQKEAVYKYVHRSQSSRSSEEEESYSFSRESTPNTTYTSPAVNGPAKSTLPIGVQRGLEKMSEELNSVNPGFTIRRHLQHADEERSMLEQLRYNIESRLKVVLPDDLSGALKDGVVLCHLANHIRPRSVSSIHVPSPAVPKLTMAKCRRNVENFIEACRRIGVPQEYLCLPSGIIEEKGLTQLAVTVQALVGNHGTKMSAV